MKKKKIEIGFAKMQVIDFGLLSKEHRDGTIKVDEQFWSDYVKTRFVFDTAHQTLIDKIRNRKKNSICKKHNIYLKTGGGPTTWYYYCEECDFEKKLKARGFKRRII